MIPIDLRQVVEEAEPLLQQIWKKRHKDTDIIVLADVEREDVQQSIRGWWAEKEIAKLKQERSGRLLFLPFLQPALFIDFLIKNGGAQREAAKELRSFAALGCVPLWVVRQGGHRATPWSPPGSNVTHIRLDPMPHKQN
jgi:hypothetical protein